MHIRDKLLPRILVDEYLCRIDCPVFAVECGGRNAQTVRELEGGFEKPNHSLLECISIVGIRRGDTLKRMNWTGVT